MKWRFKTSSARAPLTRANPTQKNTAELRPHPHPTDHPHPTPLAGVVQNVLPAPDLAALRAKALAQMEEVLAMDRWGGGKGAWTYMFGVQNDRTSMMCAPQPPTPSPVRNVW